MKPDCEAGDVITELNHQPVKNAQDAVADTEKTTGNETLVKVWTRQEVIILSWASRARAEVR